METKPLTDFQPLVSFDPCEVGIPLAGSNALMATEWRVANSCKGHFDYPACLPALSPDTRPGDSSAREDGDSRYGKFEFD